MAVQTVSSLCFKYLLITLLTNQFDNERNILELAFKRKNTAFEKLAFIY